VPISFESARSTIARRVRGNMVISAYAYASPPSRPDWLSRKEEVMLAHLRGGHSNHIAVYRGRVQGSDKICSQCRVEEDDLGHFLQRCEATEGRRSLAMGDAAPPLSILSRDPKKVVRFCWELGIA